MATFLVCPICGDHVKCIKDHQGQQLGEVSPLQECPYKKGSIHVYVKNETGGGIDDIPVSCNKTTPDTAGGGFAFFDQLETGNYPTSIALPKKMEPDYYISSAPDLTVPVQAGRITLVEFQIKPIPWIKVKVVRQDPPNQAHEGAVTLHLKQGGKEISKGFENALAHVTKEHQLELGVVTIESIDIDASCEFVTFDQN